MPFVDFNYIVASAANDAEQEPEDTEEEPAGAHTNMPAVVLRAKADKEGARVAQLREGTGVTVIGSVVTNGVT